MASERINRRTKQKAVILEFVKLNKDVHLRAEDILEGLRQKGEPVGKATVYRFLKALEDEGMIRKYTISDKTPACYQYVGDHPECRQHYHLMCSRCGAVAHVDSPAVRAFMEETLKNQGFYIDAGKTVFYGVCRDCMNKKVSDAAYAVSEVQDTENQDRRKSYD